LRTCGSFAYDSPSSSSEIPLTQVVAIIQARLGSTRLPRKVLSPIAGVPMLEHVVRRVSEARSVDQVVVATTVSSRDDAIVSLCQDRGWSVSRGSEDDVLARYHAAALSYGADVIVRVCSDCPLVDPELIDDVVGALQDRPEVDYVANNLPSRTYPIGLDLEVFRRSALETAHAEDRDPALREHVTPYIRQNPDRFQIMALGHTEDLSHHRWTVDVPEDLTLIRRVYEEMGGEPGPWRSVVELCERHPEWSQLNAHVAQKPQHIGPTR
jgi:spore coat polysaccharide biosynthesis protein SpsF